MSTPLPDEVSPITSAYLAAVDSELPGLVVGLYLTGSIPLGDYRSGRSDIDGVVVVSSPVTDPAVVSPVHAKLPERPYFDVTYLTLAALAAPPDHRQPAVYTIDGEFKDPAVVGPVTPVLWSELARQSIAVRATPDLVVLDDHQALVDHTRANLTSCWQPQLDRLEEYVASLPGDQELEGWTVPWFVLGIPRLHALLATGNIISKTAAGEHAVAVFPAYADLCTRAIDHRAGQSVTFTAADAAQTVSFGHEVVTSALNL
ncbi:nucleotidyltransferase-like protein [Kribbella antiqua]|uniref:Nucleotidyltransferase-like protein n=1 Tax=Kribbella antiqua TaxID=2512217 RepID=A0A4R2JD21_9ACTN|nr:nucleotidyltransferase domain-containing protein [Kribbella antiqua]TCO52205.1 nucleotidyltransferase-like protein [Kribbella antiqua]